MYCYTHALLELGIHKGCNLYTVVKVGGGMGQDPATEVTYLRLNLQLQIATTTSLLSTHHGEIFLL